MMVVAVMFEKVFGTAFSTCSESWTETTQKEFGGGTPRHDAAWFWLKIFGSLVLMCLTTSFWFFFVAPIALTVVEHDEETYRLAIEGKLEGKLEFAEKSELIE